jgi:hypothetical protein
LVHEQLPISKLTYLPYELGEVAALSLIHRQHQLRLLLELEGIADRWSARLGKGDCKQASALRSYFLILAELHVGLVREVRRGWIEDVEVIVVVDEFAESLHAIRRPPLSPTIERRVRREMATEVVRLS